MKRSLGLTLVGVLVILLSALLILCGVGGIVSLFAMPASAFPAPQMPGPDPKSMAMGGLGFLSLMGAFGLVNGVGLIRRWTWCRYVTMVFGFAMAALCAMSILMVAVAPFPPAPGTNAQMMGQMRTFITGFYGFWALLFVLLGLFLASKKIGDEFRGVAPISQLEPWMLPAQAPPAPVEPRPILVWIVAGLQLLGIVAIPMFLLMKTPFMFLGMLVSGYPAKFLMGCWALFSFAVGIALFKRVRSALWIAVGVYIFGVINASLLLLPGSRERFITAMNSYVPNAGYLHGLVTFSVVCGIVSTLVPVALLLLGRRRYFEWCERQVSA